MNNLPPFGLINRRQFVGGSLASAGVQLLSGTWAGSAYAAGKVPLIRTESGDVMGYATERVNVFKGIPYGASTAGAGRFKRASPVAAWNEPKVVHAVGDPCYQINEDWKGWTDNRNGSEDCLFLNVWSPISAEKRPVMVFLHGGGFWFGSGGAPLYDGERLAQRGDVVVVTVNHRLHALGFTFFGDVAPDAGFVANPGLVDLVDALQWVRKNISNFGGDPQNVTIFGESGGGGKVSCLMAMPAAKGLFHRAIVQSGAQRNLRTRDEATKDTLALLKELDVKESDAAKLAEMPVEKLYEAYQKVNYGGVAGNVRGPFCPVLDGDSLPWNPQDREALDLSREVTKMYGTNTHEAGYYLDFAGLAEEPTSDEDIIADAKAYMNLKLDDDELDDARLLLAEYKRWYPDQSLNRVRVRFLSDLHMASDALKCSLRASASKSSAPVYHYMFTWEEPYKGDFWSVHGAELLHIFDNIDADEMWGETGAPLARANRDPAGNRYLLRDNVIKAWASFAETGRPVLADGTPWPVFDAQGLNTMVLGETCEVKSDYFGAKIRELFGKIEAGVGT